MVFEQQKVVSGLPSIIFHELNGDALSDTVTWLFKEVGSVGLGQKSIVSKLCDILLIQLFRKLTEERWIIQGMLALTAEHAAMSRSKFADLFRATIGQTANDFLTDLRIFMAQQLLSQDKPVGFIANKVGY